MSKSAENSAASNDEQKLVALTTLIMLQADVRKKKDYEALKFFIVNETYRLTPFRQCIYWKSDNGKITIEAASGLSQVDPHAPYTLWLKNIIAEQMKEEESSKRNLTALNIPASEREGWKEWCGKHAVLIPFKNEHSGITGGLWIDRQEAFSNGDMSLLEQLTDAYAYSLQYLSKTSPFGLKINNPKLYLSVLFILLLTMLFPVRLSITAPAEVIAYNPFVITAPMDGVIKDVFVEPNQKVDEGNRLALIDDTDLKNQVEITSKELSVARAAYDKAAREAFSDVSKKAELEVLKADVQSKQAHLSYTQERLSKTSILAKADGVLVFSDPNDLRGAPVKAGERIMLIARPDDTQLIVRIPVDALIDIEKDIPVRLFLNIDPLNKIQAHIRAIGYEASPDPDGLITYKLKANFVGEQNKPAIGLKGTAKVYGKKSALGYKILRRPLLFIRRNLGL